MKISVIIPTYNEAARIGALIDYLLVNRNNAQVEVIVVDGGSSDHTIEIAASKEVTCLKAPQKGRANQLNYGASKATGDVFYFVHADTFPPATYPHCIEESILKGYTSGCCAYTFDSNKWPLKLNSFFTQFNGFYSGGGDQTLYVTKAMFEELGGFNPSYTIMEDFEFTKRLKARKTFKVLKSKAIVSARKYENNSYIKVNTINLLAMFMFWLKLPPSKINNLYKSLIK